MAAAPVKHFAQVFDHLPERRVGNALADVPHDLRPVPVAAEVAAHVLVAHVVAEFVVGGGGKGSRGLDALHHQIQHVGQGVPDSGILQPAQFTADGLFRVQRRLLRLFLVAAIGQRLGKQLRQSRCSGQPHETAQPLEAVDDRQERNKVRRRRGLIKRVFQAVNTLGGQLFVPGDLAEADLGQQRLNGDGAPIPVVVDPSAIHQLPQRAVIPAFGVFQQLHELLFIHGQLRHQRRHEQDVALGKGEAPDIEQIGDELKDPAGQLLLAVAADLFQDTGDILGIDAEFVGNGAGRELDGLGVAVHPVEKPLQIRLQGRLLRLIGGGIAVEEKLLQVPVVHPAHRNHGENAHNSLGNALGHKDHPALQPRQHVKNESVVLFIHGGAGHHDDGLLVQPVEQLCLAQDHVFLVQVGECVLIQIADLNPLQKERAQGAGEKRQGDDVLVIPGVELQIFPNGALAPVAVELGDKDHGAPGQGLVNLLKDSVPAVLDKIARPAQGRPLDLRPIDVVGLFRAAAFPAADKIFHPLDKPLHASGVAHLGDMVQLEGEPRRQLGVGDAVNRNIQPALHFHAVGLNDLVDHIGRFHGGVAEDQHEHLTMPYGQNAVVADVGLAVFI